MAADPLTENLATLLGAAPSLADQLPGLERAARSTAPILILGEAGSGRSSLVRALHHTSGRRGPLVEVDPGNLPTTLFESELFGYEAGAFTGAETAEQGRVARAEGGTLVLDHIEELPITSQPKLLRLLAEQRYAPLGGRERAADVRFVAIGSEDLPERVARGAFREDLFYRLEVLSFHLLPLRRRRQDLPTLLEHLLRDLAARFGRPELHLSKRARRWMLEDYTWPGNLRQMRNVLERSLILATGDELDPEPPEDARETRPRPLQEVEREEILRALAFTRGRQGEAAELLGISRKSLWEKRKRHGIP